MPTMKALQIKKYGWPLVIDHVNLPVPQPTNGQLLIRVLASAINPVDWKICSGKFRLIMPISFPFTPIFDVAGEIVAVGNGVSKFKVGEKIFGLLDIKRGGGTAEYAIISAKKAAVVPSNVSVQEAAALPIAAMSAAQMLQMANISAGARVLIVGAAGGVGHYAVQLAKALGLHVTAVCGTRNVEFVKSLGANVVLDYQQQTDFSTGEPYDAIIDCVVKYPYSRYRNLLAKRGVYVGATPTPGFMMHLLRLKVFSRKRIHFLFLNRTEELVHYVAQHVASGAVKSHIQELIPLDQLERAFQLIAAGHTRGKLVFDHNYR